MLNSALGCAVHSTLPAGDGFTTLELKVNLVRAITKDTGPLRAEARILHRGRTVATARSRSERRRRQALRARQHHLHDFPGAALTDFTAARPSLHNLRARIPQ